MKTDLYTKSVLTIIAVALVCLVIQNYNVVPQANAAEPQSVNRRLPQKNEEAVVSVPSRTTPQETEAAANGYSRYRESTSSTTGNQSNAQNASSQYRTSINSVESAPQSRSNANTQRSTTSEYRTSLDNMNEDRSSTQYRNNSSQRTTTTSSNSEYRARISLDQPEVIESIQRGQQQHVVVDVNIKTINGVVPKMVRRGGEFVLAVTNIDDY
ncbi:hypothetical protein [Parabacteroides sp. PF5-9]|uniref:hypothetical protein n=1 Tax=Parabacteroides sp. PF5-9 TaxID=1742404 RepID=UPI0024768811|nr:hypothetical protein [Parabacteroides sp. PF5-9]MDH6359057.1 cobalamin biosynthesis Mg chelatase CobN [Parabacteroides sp. PF5-9]